MKELEKYSEQLKINAPKSYESYLSERAKHEDVPYYDALRAAKTQSALTDADYGTAASRLLSRGLTASGYSDYLESRSASALAQSTDSAEHARALEKYRANAGYERYLSDYNSLQSKISEGVIKEISGGYDFDFEKALERAVSAGLSKTLAYSTAAEAVRLAKLNAYNEAITFAKLNMLSPYRAKEYALSLGLDEAYAKRVYDEISVFDEDEKKFFSSMSASQYYDYITNKAQKEKKG